MRALPLASLIAITLLASGCQGGIDEFLGRETQEKREARLRFYQFPQGDVAEPTVDIVEAAVARSEEPARVGVGIKTAGGPAPSTAYSNYVEIDCTDQNQNDINIVHERHDGVEQTTTVGPELVTTTHAPTNWGHYFEFTPPSSFDHLARFTCEFFAGFLEVDGGTFILDDPPEVEVKETEPVEDILSEIDEVFVPS